MNCRIIRVQATSITEEDEMAAVRLGPNGEVDVLDPGTPEEAVQAEAALIRFVEALARADAARDYARAVAERQAMRTGDVPPPQDS